MRIDLSNLRTRRWLTGGAVVVVLVVAGGVDLYRVHKQNAPVPVQEVASPSPSFGTSSTPSPTATSSPSPSASPTVSASASADTFPVPAQLVVTNFYTAYKAKNSEALANLFTPDTDPELISLRSRLFKGVDPQGNPGGPTLFSTNSADQSAVAYVIQSKEKLANGNWQLKLTEQRQNSEGKSAGSVNTIMTLAPVSGSSDWLIDSYAYSSASSKYGAFLIQ